MKDINGAKQMKKLTEEQQRMVNDFFILACSRRRCQNMECRNSPNEILKCMEFKQWSERILLEREEMIKTQTEAEKVFHDIFSNLKLGNENES